MTATSNFQIRSIADAEASFIAVSATLKAICEKVEIHPDRVRQFVESACGDDGDLIARAQWFSDWIQGKFDAQGERE